MPANVLLNCFIFLNFFVHFVCLVKCYIIPIDIYVWTFIYVGKTYSLYFHFKSLYLQAPKIKQVIFSHHILSRLLMFVSIEHVILLMGDAIYNLYRRIW